MNRNSDLDVIKAPLVDRVLAFLRRYLSGEPQLKSPADAMNDRQARSLRLEKNLDR